MLCRLFAELRKRALRARQRDAGDAAVLVHAAYELLDAVELELVPDPVDEGDVDHLAVEIAGEIEQEHFEQHGADIEHRPTPEARNAIIARVPDADTHRIDAVP